MTENSNTRAKSTCQTCCKRGALKQNNKGLIAADKIIARNVRYSVLSLLWASSWVIYMYVYLFSWNWPQVLLIYITEYLWQHHHRSYGSRLPWQPSRPWTTCFGLAARGCVHAGSAVRGHMAEYRRRPRHALWRHRTWLACLHHQSLLTSQDKVRFLRLSAH